MLHCVNCLMVFVARNSLDLSSNRCWCVQARTEYAVEQTNTPTSLQEASRLGFDQDRDTPTWIFKEIIHEFVFKKQLIQ